MDKGSGSGIFPGPDPGDPKRPDPTGSGSEATLQNRDNTIFKVFLLCLLIKIQVYTEML